jgi:hypothetical protein
MPISVPSAIRQKTVTDHVAPVTEIPAKRQSLNAHEALAPAQTSTPLQVRKSFLVLLFTKEQHVLFDSRSKNLHPG